MVCLVIIIRMALLEVLDRHGVPYDKEETKLRYDLLMKGLRRDPSFQKELDAFKKEAPQKGGVEGIPIPVKMSKGDFLGSEARWFVEVMGSPYAQVVIRMLFMVLFFLSYLENIPVFGSVLSAVLDVTLAGGRVLIKTIQKMIPPVIGIIPLPFMSLVGITIASVVGMLLWPILAMISFSRQDFTSAIESFLRIIPPPIGDAIADAFLDANRTIYKLNEKRKKLTDDLISGLQTIVSIGNQTGTKIGEGAEKLINKAKEVATTPLPTKAQDMISKAKESVPTNVEGLVSKPKEVGKSESRMSFAPTPVRRRGGRFSRKGRKNSKWQTRKRQTN
jgi:hypothetical protein